MIDVATRQFANCHVTLWHIHVHVEVCAVLSNNFYMYNVESTTMNASEVHLVTAQATCTLYM